MDRKMEEYQQLNCDLAKHVNILKCELRDSKNHIATLQHELQMVNYQNAELVKQQTDFLLSARKFEDILDEKLLQNSYNYVHLSDGISKITNSLRQNSAHNSMSSTRNITSHESSMSQELDLLNETFAIESDDEKENLNTTFSMDSGYSSDETISIPKSPAKSIAPKKPLKRCNRLNNEKMTTVLKRGLRCVKKIDYREIPINRKMRQIN